MKKIILLAYLLILMGCSQTLTTNTLDDSAWNYEAYYGELSNSLRNVSDITGTDQGILLFPILQSEKGSTVIMAYYDGRFQIMDDDPSSACSVKNPLECSSVFERNLYNPYIYGDKIYYYTLEHDRENDVEKNILRRRNLDGTDDEKIKEVVGDQSEKTSFYFSIHRNILYYPDQGKIYGIDLTTNKSFVLCDLGMNTDIETMFFHENTLYAGVDLYHGTYIDPILKINLDDGKIEVWKENYSGYYVDDEIIIYYEDLGDAVTYLYDIAEDKRVKLVDDYVFGAFVWEENIVLCDVMFHELYLFDRKGNLLDKIPYPNGGYPQGIYHNTFYFGMKENLLTSVEINDQRFLEPETVILYE